MSKYAPLYSILSIRLDTFPRKRARLAGKQIQHRIIQLFFYFGMPIVYSTYLKICFQNFYQQDQIPRKGEPWVINTNNTELSAGAN